TDTLANSRPVLTVGANNLGPVTFSGVIQNGTGITALTKAGTGELILTGNNIFTGPTAVSAGTLTVNDMVNNLGQGALVIGGTGILNYTGGAVTFPREIQVAGATGTLT